MKIVALTGAGISAESGLRTFRGSDGLWEGHSIEDVATPEAFKRNPGLVYEFYNQRRAQLLDPAIQPNGAHLALFELEQFLGENFQIVTQNVDNLHEKAGNQNVLHMHGELQKIRCLQTEEVFPWTQDLDASTDHPKGLSSRLRPHIVWFGEIPLSMETIEQLLFQCDIFLCIGTSGAVYPAAGFVQMLPRHCRSIEFNIEKTPISKNFTETFLGPSTETLSNWVQNFKKSHIE